MSSRSFSARAALEKPAIPKTLLITSTAFSKSRSSSLGSTIIVDCDFVKVNLPTEWISLLFIFLTRISSKVERLSPLRASSPFFTRITSFIYNYLLFASVFSAFSADKTNSFSSSSVVYFERLTLSDELIMSSESPIAVSTGLL